MHSKRSKREPVHLAQASFPMSDPKLPHLQFLMLLKLLRLPRFWRARSQLRRFLSQDQDELVSLFTTITFVSKPILNSLRLGKRCSSRPCRARFAVRLKVDYLVMKMFAFVEGTPRIFHRRAPLSSVIRERDMLTRLSTLGYAPDAVY